MSDVTGPKLSKRTMMIVFVLAFCTLMFELILSRMSVFYLNGANSFIAIPLTLFGLAVGSLRVHLSKKSVDELDIPSNLVWMTMASFFTYAISFLLFSQLFPITHVHDPSSPLLIGKTAAFVLVFLPPFYFAGKILTALYARFRHAIGRLYGMDLIGASLGCFATPVLFHFIDLPYIIFICLLAMTAVAAISLGRARLKLIIPFVALSFVMLPVLVFLEGRYDFSKIQKHAQFGAITEIAHGWNEYSRVSLLRITPRQEEQNPTYKIVHNNAESNVWVGAYGSLDGLPEAIPPRARRRVPFLLGRPVDRVMVMFAGSGKQMIEFDALGGGREYLVGVEINPLVMELATQTKEIAHYRMQDFYDLPHVEMHAAEGRAFLDNDDRIYDVIFAASDAATTKYKTGHSRKYLDTKEALESYIDHLAPGGLLMFSCQPAYHRIEALKAIFAERKLERLDRHVVISGHGLDSCTHLYFSKRPFHRSEVAKFAELYAKELNFAPGWDGNKELHTRVLKERVSPLQRLVTDDRPFIRPIDFENYQLFASKRELANHRYYGSWIKITTMLLLGVLVLGIIGALYIKRVNMPPSGMMIYLIVTGFCYMLVEIAYMARLELFLENPLYSMALLLTIFLLTNAIGSLLYNRYQRRLPMTFVPLVAAVVVSATIFLLKALIVSRLDMPLPLKLLLAVAVVSPTGVVLGFFYPYVVTWLHRHDRADAVPVTYALSTLSSVAGATYAMTMIINWGYTNIMWQAVAGYVLLAAVMLVYKRGVK
ncbi:MAG: hypothetical protein P9L99_15490 [Candidatus Lernaella stagnicola]|nr:hypothetical protein [Candidatus Lernaella stagnicola]